MNLEDFATTEFPLRVSSISEVLTCNWKYLSIALGIEHKTTNMQAYKGSAVHKAIDTFHKLEGDNNRLTKAILAMKEANGVEYFLTEEKLLEAEKFFRYYCRDTRNLHASIVATEKYFTTEIEPHKEDKTGKKIVVSGHVDQVRLIDGNYLLCDVKTNKSTSVNHIETYYYNMVFYTYLCNQSGEFDQIVKPGYLIQLSAYFQKGAKLPEQQPEKVFLSFPFKMRNIEIFIDSLRTTVKNIRNGDIQLNPSFWCNYCKFQGVINCQDHLTQLKANLQ